MSLPIPNRWLDCPRRGNLVADKFLPFKTPLDSRYNDQIPPAKRFNLDMLFGMAANIPQGKLKLIIDLTNTNRFYNYEEVEKRGVAYVKLACRGHGETPDVNQTQTFIKICKKILEPLGDDPAKPAVVGIHYSEGWDITDALNCFATARSPGIYKQDYIDELVTIYNGGEDIGYNAPALPGWCFEGGAEVPDNTNIVENGFANNGSSNPGRSKFHPTAEEIEKAGTKDVVTICPGVVAADADYWVSVRKAVADYIGWERSSFAGAQPVSFERSSLDKLRSKPYMVSWKADGTRYMLFVNEEGKSFLLDRDNCVLFVPRLELPKRPRMPHDDPMAPVTNTLMDGELVVDKMPDGTTQPRYLAYDLVVLNGQNLREFMYPRRLELLRREIMFHRDEMAKEGRLDKRLSPFSLRTKDFFGIARARGFMSERFASQVSHGVDGLIFQPADEPYKGGRCDSLLKWKPSVENTVDFRLRITRPDAKPKPGELPSASIGELHVGVGRGQERMFAQIKLNRDLRQYADRIIECAFDVTSRQWKFSRERIDKSFPNAYETAVGVCRSIVDPVTTDQLLTFIDSLPPEFTSGRFDQAPKKRPAPAPLPPAFSEDATSPKRKTAPLS